MNLQMRLTSHLERFVQPAFRLVMIAGRALGLVGPDYRRAADAARDRRDWTAAGALYRSYLDRRPNDGPLWVQLGHACKETGDLDRAEAAYARSLQVRQTADGFLQLGHILKLKRQIDAAARAYARAYELDPTSSNPAFAELMAADADSHVLAPLNEDVLILDAVRRLYLDLTDLVAYLRANTSLSGIQRVVANLLIHAKTYAQKVNVEIVPVLPAYRGDVLRSIEAATVVHLLEIVEQRAGRAAIDMALVAVLRSRRIIRPNPGDTFVIAGAFWIYQRYDLLNAMRRRGVSVAVFIHDLIQITDPAYVEPAATEVFRRSFVDVLDTSSFILTNSAFVAGEVRRFLTERMTFQIPVQPVTLATELGVVVEPGAGAIPHDIGALAGTDYVLVTGTIEIRKNHIYVARMWERLLMVLGEATPQLVFGQMGVADRRAAGPSRDVTDAEGQASHLQRHPGRSAGIPVPALPVHDLPELCRGVGPAGRGEPRLRQAVHRLIGNSHPGSGRRPLPLHRSSRSRAGFAVVHQALSDRADLARWTERVRRDFQPKSWLDFAFEMYGATLALAEDAQRLPHRNNVVIPPGRAAFFGDGAIAEAYAAGELMLNARMSRVSGWGDLDHWGCWAAEHCAALVINTTLPPGTRATVFLLVCGPDPKTTILCDVQVTDGPAVPVLAGTIARWTAATGRVAGDGTLAVRIRSAPVLPVTAAEADRLVGLVALGYAPAGDRVAQMRFAESVIPLDPAAS